MVERYSDTHELSPIQKQVLDAAQLWINQIYANDKTNRNHRLTMNNFLRGVASKIAVHMRPTPTRRGFFHPQDDWTELHVDEEAMAYKNRVTIDKLIISGKQFQAKEIPGPTDYSSWERRELWSYDVKNEQLPDSTNQALLDIIVNRSGNIYDPRLLPDD